MRIQANPKRILYVANFEPRKNHALLFDALAQPLLACRRDIELVLVGRAHFATHETVFSAEFDAVRSSGRVRVLANLRDDALADVYASANVFAGPLGTGAAATSAGEDGAVGMGMHDYVSAGWSTFRRRCRRR